MNFNESLARALNLNLGLEDNAQVEVNFNIDTDPDGAPKDVIEQNEVPAAETAPAAPEGMDDEQSESEAAEDEVEQLEEAQNSLESLKLIIDKHATDGTLSRTALGVYGVALEALIPEKVLQRSGAVSMENRAFTSRHHASLIAQVELEEIGVTLEQITMESKAEWFKKKIHQIDVLFRAEKALAKRARGLLAIAETSKHEHAAHKNMTVNQGRKSLELPILATDPWSDDGAFVAKVKSFADLYIHMGTVRKGGIDADVMDTIFPGARNWKKDKDGIPTYPMFQLILQYKGHGVTSKQLPTNKEKREFPVLTPKACQQALHIILDLAERGKLLEHNMDLMLGVLMKTAEAEQTNGVPGKHVKTQDYNDMYNTMHALWVQKNQVITEMLNYINYSLTDREFN